jgi:hypothetical protein
VSPAEARAALAVAECRRDWETVKTHLARARGVDPSRGDAPAALVALSLDHAYQAFEAILVRLERASGLPERTGTGWHQALLADAAVARPGPTRPCRRRDGCLAPHGAFRAREWVSSASKPAQPAKIGWAHGSAWRFLRTLR